jgi:hypothetical protein
MSMSMEMQWRQLASIGRSSSGGHPCALCCVVCCMGRQIISPVCLCEGQVVVVKTPPAHLAPVRRAYAYADLLPHVRQWEQARSVSSSFSRNT